MPNSKPKHCIWKMVFTYLRLGLLAQAHYNLGVDFYNQGHSKAAVEEMRKALAVNPGLASAHYNIGHILDAIGTLLCPGWLFPAI